MGKLNLRGQMKDLYNFFKTGPRFLVWMGIFFVSSGVCMGTYLLFLALKSYIQRGVL